MSPELAPAPVLLQRPEGGGDEIPYYAISLTIDPNDPTQNTWFATMYDDTSNNTDEIYKTTDGTCSAGATWTVWSTIGQGMSLWIQPGGTQRGSLLSSQEDGIYYTPDYQAANPLLYQIRAKSSPMDWSPISLAIHLIPINSGSRLPAMAFLQPI